MKAPTHGDPWRMTRAQLRALLDSYHRAGDFGDEFQALARIFNDRFDSDKRRANPLSRVKVGSPSMLTGEAPTKRLRKRRAKTEQLPAGYYANPLSRVKVSSPSQRPSLLVVSEHGDPSPRLKKRRAKTAQLKRPGAYANPTGYRAWSGESAEWKGLTHHLVQVKTTYARSWATKGVFKTKADAHQYAHALHAADDSLTIRVVSGK